MGKGHERSLWEQEEARVRAHGPAAPDAHGTAFALGTDCPEVRGTASVTGDIPAALQACPKGCRSHFHCPEGLGLQPSPVPNCSDLPSPDPYCSASSPVYGPDFLNCSFFHY